MHHVSSIRRTAAVAGTAGIIALTMAAPASARPDPGNGSQSEWSCHSLCYEGGTEGSSGGLGPNVITTDDNAIELLQLGAGVLGGIALAGAGVAVASRRSRAHAAHPA
jgi:hypothetical protein